MNRKLTHFELESLLDKTTKNSVRIQADTKCGCFACGKTFPGSEATGSVMEHPYLETRTVTCPLCGLDTVLAESDLPEGQTLDSELLEQMTEYYGV